MRGTLAGFRWRTSPGLPLCNLGGACVLRCTFQGPKGRRPGHSKAGRTLGRSLRHRGSDMGVNGTWLVWNGLKGTHLSKIQGEGQPDLFQKIALAFSLPLPFFLGSFSGRYSPSGCFLFSSPQHPPTNTPTQVCWRGSLTNRRWMGLATGRSAFPRITFVFILNHQNSI